MTPQPLKHPKRLPGTTAGSRGARARRLLLASPAALALAFAGGAAGCGSGGGAAHRARALVPIGARLSGAAGLRATVYASGLPTVSAFAFDARGRLWATTSAASGHRHDGVYLIARAGATPVKVVTGLKGPLGLTWLGDTLYVASIGRVDAFAALRGTRFTRRRIVLREPAGHGWNDNLVASPDGRLVMSISTACDHCRSRTRWAASIVSFRPDGSDVRVYARNVRAGYGLAFVPGTRDLLVSMNQRDDLGTRTPGDWLTLVREGEDWRFPGCYGQGGAACASVPAPLAVLDAHAAAGGVAVLSGGLGPSIPRSALVSEWQRGVVMRAALKRAGSAYARAPATPFLTGLQAPLPVASTADGAVLVGDWKAGNIYRIARA